jgi:hypothetical protein
MFYYICCYMGDTLHLIDGSEAQIHMLQQHYYN